MSEKLSTLEQAAQDATSTEAADFPAFDPENAKKLQIQAKVNQIAEKNNYNPELTEALTAIVPELADYYKDPELAIQTLEECPIHLQEQGESISEFLTNYFESPHEGFPPIAMGAYIVSPKPSEDDMIEAKRLLYLRKGDLSSKSHLSVLTHELSHAMATTGKKPVLEDDGRVRIDIGAASEYYTFDENGLPQEAGDVNGGLEEMLNTDAENHVMRKVLQDDSYRSSTYPVIQEIARLMPAQLLEALQNDRIHGTNTATQILPAEQLAQANTKLDAIAQNFTITFTEMKRRGGGKAIAAENRELAQQALDIYKI